MISCSKLLPALLILFLTSCGGSHPQPAAEEQSGSSETARPTSPPYEGDLSIFEEEGRGERLQIDRVMDLLEIGEGTNVADIGAGSGWFTVRAARRVGADGAVFAVEINAEYAKHIEERAAGEQLGNVRVILGSDDDPRLPAGGIDAVLLLKTYHELARPVALLENLRKAMRPGALLGVIDREGSGDDHGVAGEVVIREAAEAGFSLEARHDFVKPDGMDYFLIFRAPALERGNPEGGR